MSNTRAEKARVFIGSSTEGREIAEYIQLGLDEELETTVWCQGVFGLSECTLESLTHHVRDFDFSVLVLSADDLTQKRGRVGNTPRDNVLFELGLFMGALGRNRTFIVHSRDESLELPSDLAGVTAATFASRRDGNLQAAMGPVCTQLKAGIRSVLGTAPSSRATVVDKPRITKYTARRRRRRSLGTACASGPKKTYGIVNISSSGALLETEGELKIGKLLDLDLNLDNTATAHVTARVVRVQHPAWRLAGGIGVTFMDYAPGSAKTIAEYVAADPIAC